MLDFHYCLWYNLHMDLKVRDVVMDTILIILVGIQAFIILDEISDGKLSREMSVKIAYYRARIKNHLDREEAIRKSIGPVIFDAINTVETAGATDGNDAANEGDN